MGYSSRSLSRAKMRFAPKFLNTLSQCSHFIQRNKFDDGGARNYFERFGSGQDSLDPIANRAHPKGKVIECSQAFWGILTDLFERLSPATFQTFLAPLMFLMIIEPWARFVFCH